MGTLFAGIIRAPMTSVFMVFEITQDYQILVPLMVANLLSFVISRRFQPLPIYHALLRQDGIHLPSSEAPREDGWTVRNVMRVDPPMVPASTSIAQAAAVLEAGDAARALVGSREQLVGIVTRSAAVSARDAGHGDQEVASIVRPPRVHVHPDHRMDVLFERWRSAEGMLPVVRRDDDSRVEGVVTIDEITTFLSSSDLGEFESAAGAETHL